MARTEEVSMSTRREFLKGLSAASATALLGPGLLSEGAMASVSSEGAWRTTGSHWGAIKALVKGGKVVEAYPTDPKGRRLAPVSSFMGLPAIYQKAGFVACARPSKSKVVMRYRIDKSYNESGCKTST